MYNHSWYDINIVNVKWENLVFEISQCIDKYVQK